MWLKDIAHWMKMNPETYYEQETTESYAEGQSVVWPILRASVIGGKLVEIRFLVGCLISVLILV